MNKKETILAVLSPSKGKIYPPVQVQKLLFLVDQKVGKSLGGPFFNFIPYHYGPFDKSIYSELENLSQNGDVEIITESNIRWNRYKLTPQGQVSGEQLLKNIDPRISEYIAKLNEFVTSLSFTELLSSIYGEYPEMKKNSIFQV